MKPEADILAALAALGKSFTLFRQREVRKAMALVSHNIHSSAWRTVSGHVLYFNRPVVGKIQHDTRLMSLNMTKILTVIDSHLKLGVAVAFFLIQQLALEASRIAAADLITGSEA